MQPWGQRSREHKHHPGRSDQTPSSPIFCLQCQKKSMLFREGMQASALSVVHYPDTAPASKTVLLRLLKVRLGEMCCDFCVPFTFHLQDLLNLSDILLSVSSSSKQPQTFKYVSKAAASQS